MCVRFLFKKMFFHVHMFIKYVWSKVDSLFCEFLYLKGSYEVIAFIELSWICKTLVFEDGDQKWYISVDVAILRTIKQSNI